MERHFYYKDTGLPLKDIFMNATEKCHTWLMSHASLSKFGPDGISNFMHNQPVRAAKKLSELTDNPSETLITVTLLGPAKFTLLGAEAQSRKAWGDDVVDFLQYLSGDKQAANENFKEDEVKLFLVEGLSTMHDQLLDRDKVDLHHEIRWEFVKHFEQRFAEVKGQNPGLDALFEKDLIQSRKILEGLDQKFPDKVEMFKKIRKNMEKKKGPKR